MAITILFSAIALPVLPTASAHGICTGLPPRYARLGSYVLSNESIQTGENVTITGELVSMTNKTVQVRLLLYSEPSPHGRWITLSTNPSGSFVLSGNSVISYSITAKALLPGKYYLDPGIDLVGIGASLMNNGCPASSDNIQVYGNPLCAINLVAVIKSEDGSPACVKPDTAQKLIERDWGFDPSSPLEITGLRDSYAVGEIINFQVKFNEMIGDCTEPSVWVVNQTNQTVWKSKEISVPCPPDLILHHAEGEMKFGNPELGYLSINQTGTYHIHTWFGKEITKKISII